MIKEDNLNLMIYERKVMILMNNGLPVTSENLKKLDGLWDENQKYNADKVFSLVEAIKQK